MALVMCRCCLCIRLISDRYVHFFFFKQKTAYEMRISDWSSDVCSSDLMGAWTFGIVVLLAFLIGPIWAWHSFRHVDERPQGYHADMTWSSGPLSSAHANLKGDCQACHVQPFVAVTDKEIGRAHV